MVKSGLDHKNFEGPSDVPRVSQYRLAAHLSMAMGLYSLLAWNAMEILLPAATIKSDLSQSLAKKMLRLRGLSMGAKALVLATAISGAFVAGLDAGLVYNSFPLMADRFIPCDLLAYKPTWKNFTENPTTVQFDHRVLGVSTWAYLTSVAVMARRLPLPGRAGTAALTLGTLAWLQAGLGISTLLLYVPVPLASAHQCGAMATLTAALWLSKELKVLKTLKKIAK